MKLFQTLIVIVCVFACITNAQSDEIYLKNGDRVTGRVVGETNKNITISTESMGMLVVKKGFVKSYDCESCAEDAEAPVVEEEAKWTREISFGYTQAGGNTEKSQGNLDLIVKRKTDSDEFSAKGTAYYSSSNQQMDAKKFSGKLRYAYSFGEEKRWYHFYKGEG